VVNQREKEEYLREYSKLKSEGKPFFPYAVAKDALMGVLVVAVIVALSIVFGAELGPKANAATTTYDPRNQTAGFHRSLNDRRTDASDHPVVSAAVLRSRPRASPATPPDRDY
jgi:hypothetical protein